MKIQLIELYSLQDLLALNKHVLFRMDFDNLGLSVYYSGVTGNDFIGLNMFISNKKYSGHTSVNYLKEIKSEERMSPSTVQIIPVKSDTLLKGVFANYIVANFGFEKKYEELAEKASKLLSELKVEKAIPKSHKKLLTQQAKGVSLKGKSLNENTVSVLPEEE